MVVWEGLADGTGVILSWPLAFPHPITPHEENACEIITGRKLIPDMNFSWYFKSLTRNPVLSKKRQAALPEGRSWVIRGAV